MRLLLIEDDPEVTRVVRRGLQTEGFALDVASDGVDGLWQAKEGEFDAVVLDLLLPGMSGYAVCESLREHDESVPIVVLTAKSGGSATNAITCGPIRFDVEAHRCWLDDVEVELTAKEAEVLYVLVAANGDAVSRHEMVTAAWGMDFEGDPGSVDVYVNRLRKKLGAATIRNIRGRVAIA